MPLSLILHSIQVFHPSYKVLGTVTHPVCDGRDSELASHVARGFPDADTSGVTLATVLGEGKMDLATV